MNELRFKLYNTMWDLIYKDISELNKNEIILWNKAITLLENILKEGGCRELNEEERELISEVYILFE